MEEQNTSIENNITEATEAQQDIDVTTPTNKAINKKTTLAILLGAVVVILAIAITIIMLARNNPGNGKDLGSTAKMDENYNIALELIEKGDYAEAYAILKQLGDYKDAQERLAKFQFIPINVTVITKQNDVVIDGYTSGCNISYNKHHLPQCVEMYESLVGHGEYDYEERKTTEYIYNTNGKIINEIRKESDGDKNMYDYTYDARGNVIEEVHTDSDSNRTVTTYTYDIDNNLIKEVLTYSNGAKHICEYNYDTNGNLLKKFNKSISQYYVSQAGSIYDYTYDEYGNLIKEVLSNSSNGYIIDYTYDRSGNLIKKVKSNSSQDYIIDYTYDQSGNLIKEVDTRANSNDRVIKYEYSENGKLIKKVTNENYIEKYSYDENGNHVEYIISAPMANGAYHGEQICSITYSLVYIEFETSEYQKLLEEVIPLDFY